MRCDTASCSCIRVAGRKNDRRSNMCSKTSVVESVRWAFKFSSWHPTKEQMIHAISLVQPEEKERIGKFVFQKDVKAALVGRLLIRKVIADQLKVPYKGIKLARTAKGKPYLVNMCMDYPMFNFNVSHQGDYAVLAAEPKHQVGIDVMQIEYPRGSRTVEEFFDTMNRQFTDQEWDTILEKPDTWEQLKQFYRYWCLKESYVKAIGVGIGFSINRLDFVTSSETTPGTLVNDTIVCLEDKREKEWHFTETMLDDTHVVAVGIKACQGTPLALNVPFTILDFNELVNKSESQTDPDEEFWEKYNSKQNGPVKKR